MVVLCGKARSVVEPLFAGDRGCDWPGCAAAGIHRAPRSRRNLRQFWWFCIDHVRVYNAAWNYYDGMSDAEVEADVRFDTVWQRPSWRFGTATRAHGPARAHVHDDFGFFESGNRGRAAPPPPLSAEDEALAALDLKAPVTVAVVKARYKQLVKLHHPDLNGGDKGAEERFKKISAAYRAVIMSLTA